MLALASFLNLCHAQFSLYNIKICEAFLSFINPNILQVVEGILVESKDEFICVVNTMVTDDMVIQRPKASITIMALLSRISLDSGTNG